MKVTITQDDIKSLNIYMLTLSKNAKKQRLLSFYAIPFEFILVGIFIDGIFKTVPVASVSSLVLAALWLLIYPKLYKKTVNKHLQNAKNIAETSVEMNFSVDDEFVIFSSDEAKTSDKFRLKDLKSIDESDKNYFIGFKNGTHIVLPINDETRKEVENLSQKNRVQVYEVSIREYK